MGRVKEKNWEGQGEELGGSRKIVKEKNREGRVY